MNTFSTNYLDLPTLKHINVNDIMNWTELFNLFPVTSAGSANTIHHLTAGLNSSWNISTSGPNFTTVSLLWTHKTRCVLKIVWHKNWLSVAEVSFPQCRSPTTTEDSMMTSSNGNIFRVTGPLCGEFTGPGEFPTQRPVTQSFDVFFDLRLNKRLSKQPWGW